MLRPLLRTLFAGLLLVACHPAPAQHTAGGTDQRDARAFAQAQKAFRQAEKDGPLALRAFLLRMPKGADLHVHLSGAIYAETLLDEAAADGMCVEVATLSIDKASEKQAPQCRVGEVAAATVAAAARPEDQHLYDEMIDSLSMRSFVPVTGESGHDHFFATFDRFGGVGKRHMGQWLDEVATRAAAQNEQYMELMDTPEFKPAAALAAKIGYTRDFAKYREEMLAGGLDASIAPARALLDRAEQDRRAREHCDTPAPAAACQVQLRYIAQVLRGISPEVDFAQILLAFELASADPRVVGLNLVRPEDWVGPLTYYREDMAIVGALHALYPKVHISLHAGELAPGLVKPADLAFHIREAVEEAHADRIGHGVDVMYEERPYELLKEMAARRVMVEINLTSNDVILNVKGDEHPLPQYLAAHVPVALSTDDEGVSRIDLTHEYVRAVVTYHLGYAELKQMARASIEHSFLPGAGLWRESVPEVLGEPVAACRGQVGAEKATGGCEALVAGSEKAQQEWELERRFHVFEASF